MEHFSTNAKNRIAIALVLALAATVGAVVGPAGAASGTTELANGTVSVDNSTRSVYAEVSAAESNVTVNVTYYGVADGNETQVAQNASQTVVRNDTRMFELPANSTAYDSYRVHVVAQANETNATAATGAIEKVSGSGGGLFDGVGSESKGGIAVLLLLGAYLVFSGGDDS
jgi:hypothetical protein